VQAPHFLFRMATLLGSCLTLWCSAQGADSQPPGKPGAASPREPEFQGSPQEEVAEAARLFRQAVDHRGRVTNEVAHQQWAALNLRRYYRFIAALESTNDPVAVAIEMTREQGGSSASRGMFELKKHWQDPRVEPALATMAASGPHGMGDGLVTPAGRASGLLIEIRAQKQLHAIVAGRLGESDRTKALMVYLRNNSDLVQPYPPAVEKAVLARLLFQELAKSNDTNAVFLVLKSGHITPDFARKHHPAMMQFARGLTVKEAVLNPPLVERLYDSQDPAAIPLFEQWLPHATTEGQKSYFESAIRELRKPKRN